MTACNNEARDQLQEESALSMLTVTEDMLLLSLRRDGGRFPARHRLTLRHSLTGSALLDLDLAHRVDTNLELLEVIDPTPTGKPFLDPMLEEIASSGKTRDIWGWLRALMPKHGEAIREKAVESLLERRVLERRPRGVFGERYRCVNETDARARIEEILFSDDEIPDPHDIALVCVADACDLLHSLFRKKRLKRAMARLQQLRKMDPVGGGTVAQIALWNIERSAL